MSTVNHYGKVAVMFGGHSAEREVSLRSGQAVLDALLSRGVDAYKFDPAVRSVSELVAEKFDNVLIMLHGRGGEDGSLQGLLEQLQIPYTGSGVLGSALSMDKIRTKQIFSSVGLPTANYKIVEKSCFDAGSCEVIMQEFGGAIMVKPALEGSSIGMTKVTKSAQLLGAVQHAFKYDNNVLLEQYIEGSEFTVSILDGKALPSIRMSTPRDFYDYEAKYQADSTQYFCPSGASDELETQLADYAERAFKAVGAGSWGRVDFMCDSAGQLYLLEVNTVPGMTAKSLVPMAAKQAGYSFADLVEKVLSGAGLNK
ncbi:D-alanine--D-alanine ligase [Neptunicella marina]|uniref:D-alanine--D-alanine ligase n=1 Tax=Neptunicella marina TaxID=2125989 RepID=A0A8J6IT29_9ALTE|nr:D-alanine--D-alanine ligase [Neptunicella marina]MBC3765300.1 D-alanine--D-alanine ligase [Neptunicella marina]